MEDNQLMLQESFWLWNHMHDSSGTLNCNTLHIRIQNHLGLSCPSLPEPRSRIKSVEGTFVIKTTKDPKRKNQQGWVWSSGQNICLARMSHGLSSVTGEEGINLWNSQSQTIDLLKKKKKTWQ